MVCNDPIHNLTMDGTEQYYDIQNYIGVVIPLNSMNALHIISLADNVLTIQWKNGRQLTVNIQVDGNGNPEFNVICNGYYTDSEISAVQGLVRNIFQLMQSYGLTQINDVFN